MNVLDSEQTPVPVASEERINVQNIPPKSIGQRELDETVLTESSTNTLTNKTLTSPTLTNPVLNGTLSGTAFLDEDAMSSNSAVAVASQQSIKAYVDTTSSTTAGYTALASTFTGAANTSEQTVTGLTTAVTDLGVNMKVYASASLSLDMGTTGNNEVRLYINGTEVSHWYRLSAVAIWHITLSGVASVSTGADVSVQVRVISDNSTVQTVYASRARSSVSVIVFPA